MAVNMASLNSQERKDSDGLIEAKEKELVKKLGGAKGLHSQNVPRGWFDINLFKYLIMMISCSHLID